MIELVVFRLQLPLRLAPVLNKYATMPSFRRAEIRHEVDVLILQAKGSYRLWPMGVQRSESAKVVKGKIKREIKVIGGRRRLVRLTRYSSKDSDEWSCDVLGGKIPIDRLVQAQILRDDSRQWMEREARWVPAPPKGGKVVLEVFDL